ncbi:MAG: serine/threonine-protein kinase [Myxococcota bacterium]
MRKHVTPQDVAGEEEIARGATSSVRRARDEDLERWVARKVLHAERAREPVEVERFNREARLTAQLEHPHVVPVHALGIQEDGTPWFTMQRVEGRALHELLPTSLLQQKPEEAHALLEVFLKVCDAVSFAHSMGIIHRDIKPQNVVVGSFGQVYLMDWGTAQRLGAAHQDPPGTVVGTLAYLSPEQARGDTAALDERTDVFGLGAVLYQILTLSPPYSARSVKEMLIQARNGLIRDPQSVATGVTLPRELCRIAMKALNVDPRARHASAAALKRDVQTFVRSGFLRFRTEEYAAGEYIVREGGQGDAVYIITSGRCEVSKEVSGQENVLRTMEEGDVFGEMAALTGPPRTATVRALTPVTVAVVGREDLEEKLAMDTWAGKLVTTLAQRFRELDQRYQHAVRERDEALLAVRALTLLRREPGISSERLCQVLVLETGRSAEDVTAVLQRAAILC